jgi:hypothetical protein
LIFLRDLCQEGDSSTRLGDLFRFPEIKQNWFGFSIGSNRGSGLGANFATAISRAFKNSFKDFGSETISTASHLEKLTLIGRGIGRDNISDFTVNLIHGFLLEYTQGFAMKHISADKLKVFRPKKVKFNFETRTWATAPFTLPCMGEDYVLLCPRDILTKDETWISQPDFVHRCLDIVQGVENETLRAQMNQYIQQVFRRRKMKAREVQEATLKVIEQFPVLADYYIRDREENGDQAKTIAEGKVAETYEIFIKQVGVLIAKLEQVHPGGRPQPSTIEEAHERLSYFKRVIEDQDGYRVFYHDGKPIRSEHNLQLLFRLVWCGTTASVGGPTATTNSPPATSATST